VRWNPTLFYLEELPGFIVGFYSGRGSDAAGWSTLNLVLCLGLVAVRIEKGVPR
jgi:hypothetical protein